MKKLPALLLSLSILSALSACGTSEQVLSAEESPPQQPSQTELESAQPDKQQKSSDWSELERVLTIAYSGSADTGETVVFMLSEDSSLALICVANTYTGESICISGETAAFELENGSVNYTISDETQGLCQSLNAQRAENGSIRLDMDELGFAEVAGSSQETVFELLASLSIDSVAIA